MRGGRTSGCRERRPLPATPAPRAARRAPKPRKKRKKHSVPMTALRSVVGPKVMPDITADTIMMRSDRPGRGAA